MYRRLGLSVPRKPRFHHYRHPRQYFLRRKVNRRIVAVPSRKIIRILYQLGLIGPNAPNYSRQSTKCKRPPRRQSQAPHSTYAAMTPKEAEQARKEAFNCIPAKYLHK